MLRPRPPRDLKRSYYVRSCAIVWYRARPWAELRLAESMKIDLLLGGSYAL